MNIYEKVQLYIACRMGDTKMVKSFIDKGADVNSAGFLGRTPLHAASQYKHIKIVKLLLNEGADPNQADRAGITPLYSALCREHTIIMAMLMRDMILKKQIKPRYVTKDKKASYMWEDISQKTKKLSSRSQLFKTSRNPSDTRQGANNSLTTPEANHEAMCQVNTQYMSR